MVQKMYYRKFFYFNFFNNNTSISNNFYNWKNSNNFTEQNFFFFYQASETLCLKVAKPLKQRCKVQMISHFDLFLILIPFLFPFF